MPASHNLICGHCVISEGSTNAPGRTLRPLTARERQLVELVFRKPPLTNTEIAERMGATKATTASRLISLRRKGWAIPSRRGQTRPEPDWYAAAIPLIRSYRAGGMTWTAIGRQLGRSRETIRKLFLRQVQDTSQ